MAYKLLGMAVWKGAKYFLRRKATAASPPKPLLAGAVAVLVLGAALLAISKKSSTS